MGVTVKRKHNIADHKSILIQLKDGTEVDEETYTYNRHKRLIVIVTEDQRLVDSLYSMSCLKWYFE